MSHETLYRKVIRGKRTTYVVAYSAQSWDMPDLMRPGTFRMTYAYANGSRRYEYAVTPDTAGFMAAATIARQSMEDAIKQASNAKPTSVYQYTKQQLAVLNDCRKRMESCGALLPSHWEHTSAYDISQAAIDAVRNFKP